jgi:hypothetical protein
MMNVNTNKDRKTDKPSLANPEPDTEDAASKVGPYNPALGEIYQRLYPEMRRPKPNQEAIAAALQAMQRLTMKMDSETSAEETSHAHPSVGCNACGHPNREGNRFCAMCGERLQSPTEEGGTPLLSSAASSPSKPRVERRPSQDFLRPEVQPEAASPETRGEREEIEAATSAAPGTHHYHHHYHHHYFPGGSESASTSSRGAAPEIARETDRLRIAAAAKGEPITRNEAAVRRITQEWVLACNTRQLDELLDLYAPDALVLRSNLPMLRGAAQVREFFFSALESGLGEVSLEPMLQCPGSRNLRKAPRGARQISLGLRQAERRRLEAGLGMLVERSHANQRGIRHSQSCGRREGSAAEIESATSPQILHPDA